MQKDTLLALLHQPEALLNDHLEELEEIIQKYPYFHLPHTLLAKLLHDQQSSLAPQKIRKASLYVYNRAMLKTYILENFKKIDVEEEFNYQDKPQRNPFADIQQEIDDFDKKMENSSIEDLEKELASITESYLPKDYLAEEAKLQANEEISEPIEQTENQKEQNSLIDDFLNNFNKSSETPVSETFTSPIIADDSTEEEAIRLFDEGNTQAAIAIYEQLKLKFPEKASYYQSQIDIFSMDFSNLNVPDSETSTNFQSNPQESFDTNLLINEFLSSPTTTPTEEVSNQVSEENTEELTLQEETKLNIESSVIEEIISTETTSSNQEVQNIAEEDSPSEKLENVIGINSEITESQAITYFNEGNIAKAIEIYRQLMLQNPDKKAYFASQIEILES
jgi:tetratricopeptide (TPR) repeat protein